jgi:hypothetical protein
MGLVNFVNGTELSLLLLRDSSVVNRLLSLVRDAMHKVKLALPNREQTAF